MCALLLVLTLTFVNSAIKPVSGQTQTWSKYLGTGGPVLAPGSGAAWDSAMVFSPTAFKDENTYRLYYSGFSTGGAPGSYSIGYAYSVDRVTFTKYAGNPILTPGSGGAWDGAAVFSPCVLKARNGTYLMWYTGYSPGRIGVARSNSPEGPWTKAASPVLSTGVSGSWDSNSVGLGTVLWDERAKIYRMWYYGCPSIVLTVRNQIGYATSIDGQNWEKYNLNPVLTPGASGAWDDYEVYYPTVLKIGGVFWMWYTGCRLVGGGLTYGIGCACSIDGVSWTKWSANPILTPGPAGSWDSSAVLSPTVFTWDPSDLIFGGTRWLGMYYGAYSPSTGYGIGHATTLFGVANLPLFTDSPVLFINADPSRSQYAAYDSLSAGILYGLCYKPQYQGFDTNPSWVTQTGADKGKLLVTGKSVVLMGGYGANWVVNYYEKTAGTTPVYFRVNTAANTFEWVDRATGVAIANVPQSIDFTRRDFLVIMTFGGLTGSGNDITIMYGIGWRGTWAGGVYFKDVIWGTGDASYYVGYSYIILEWNDANGDTAPQANEVVFRIGR